jgi:hypothetical protein
MQFNSSGIGELRAVTHGRESFVQAKWRSSPCKLKWPLTGGWRRGLMWFWLAAERGRRRLYTMPVTRVVAAAARGASEAGGRYPISPHAD